MEEKSISTPYVEEAACDADEVFSGQGGTPVADAIEPFWPPLEEADELKVSSQSGSVGKLRSRVAADMFDTFYFEAAASSKHKSWGKTTSPQFFTTPALQSKLSWDEQSPGGTWLSHSTRRSGPLVF